MPELKIENSLVPALTIGAIAGLDNVIAALAIGALIFSGPLAPGLGLGVSVIILGGALIAFIAAVRSAIPNSIALVQEATIAILATVILTTIIQIEGDKDVKVATAIAMIGTSAIVTGALFWITGRLKIGRLVRYLPYPVVAGFLAGSGWLLLDGAVKMMTGFGFGREFLAALSDPYELMRVIPAACLASILLFFFTRYRHYATIPILMCVAVLAFYAVLWALGISHDTARQLGHLPPMVVNGETLLPSPKLLAQANWSAIIVALPNLLAIAGLTMVGFMLNIGGLELTIGRDVDLDAELRSTGIANLASGGVGGPAGYVGLAMTTLAENAGVHGRSVGIATAAFMLIGLFLAGPLIFQLPVFLTGGFVLFLGLGLTKEWLFDTRNRMPLSEWLIVATILLTVVFIGFMEGMLIGLLVSSGLFVFKYSRLPVVLSHVAGDARRSTVDRSLTDVRHLSDHGQTIEIVQLQGFLFFGTAERVVDLVRNRLADEGKQKLRFIILDFHAVSGADTAAIAGFLKIKRLVEGKQIRVYYTRVPKELEDDLKSAGIDQSLQNLIQFETDLDRALELAEDALLSALEQDAADHDTLSYFEAAIGPHPRLQELIDKMTLRKMQPEEVLIEQGELANDIFFVAKGRVRIQKTLANGKPLRLRTMMAGAVVGEIALYLQQPRTADVIVDVPSEVLQLSAAELSELEQNDPELAILAHRLMATNVSEKLSVANRAILAAQT